MDFNLIDITISIRTDNPAALALRLFGTGADFAKACRNVACLRPGCDCLRCSGRGDCAWQIVFGQDLAVDPEALRRHQKPPLPFVFSFPVPQGGEQPNGVLECRLVVAGVAISCLDMLLGGFENLLSGQWCHQLCEILLVESNDYQGARLLLAQGSGIFYPENLVVLSSAGIVESHAWDLSRQNIHLLSPVKLLVDGRQQKRFSFNLFARSLLRRISALAYYYGGCEPVCDFVELSHQADAILCTDDRFGFGQVPGGDKKMSGICGQGCFSGDFRGLLPFLVIGSYMHVGKSAAFGMGHYALSAGVSAD